jgi:hypothetical protein
MYTRTFWIDTGERAVATFAQTLVALILTAVGGEITGTVDVTGVAWLAILGSALLAAGLSVLKALAAGRNDGNPSVGNRDVGAFEI